MRTLAWISGGLLLTTCCVGGALSIRPAARTAPESLASTGVPQQPTAVTESAVLDLTEQPTVSQETATVETAPSEMDQCETAAQETPAPLSLVYQAVVQPVAIDFPQETCPVAAADNTEVAAAEPVAAEPMLCQPDTADTSTVARVETVAAFEAGNAVKAVDTTADRLTPPGRLQTTWGERQGPAWSELPVAESRKIELDAASGDLLVRDVVDSPAPGQKPTVRRPTTSSRSELSTLQDSLAPLSSIAQTKPSAPVSPAQPNTAAAPKSEEPKKLVAARPQPAPPLKDLFATRSVAEATPTRPRPAPAPRTIARKARPLQQVAHDEFAQTDITDGDGWAAPKPKPNVATPVTQPELATAAPVAQPELAAATPVTQPEPIAVTPVTQPEPAVVAPATQTAPAVQEPTPPIDLPQTAAPQPGKPKRVARPRPTPPAVAPQPQPVAAQQPQPVATAQKQPQQKTVTAQPQRTAPVINAMAPYVDQRTTPAISETELFDLQRHAMAHVRRGFQLGGRFAIFAARAEFVQGLIVIAQALDAQQMTTAHSRALAEGLQALSESDDFLPSRQASPAIVDLASIVERHRTTALKDADLMQTPTLIARQRYLDFAQERLAFAVDMQTAGAMALHGLAKLGSLADSQSPEGVVRTNGKAMALEQAALAVDPGNFMAANDLAVLLYQQGRMGEARALLRGCVGMSTEPMLWHNLAAVHDALGETRQAQLARAEATKVQRNAKSRQNQLGMPLSPQPDVQWVEPQAFAASGQSNSDGPSAPVPPAEGKRPVEAARRPTGKGFWK